MYFCGSIYSAYKDLTQNFELKILRLTYMSQFTVSISFYNISNYKIIHNIHEQKEKVIILFQTVISHLHGKRRSEK